MNQGNSGRFVGDDGVYQDGGLLVHFPGPAGVDRGVPEVPVAGWHTDDTTGHAIPPSRRPTRGNRSADRPEPPTDEEPHGLVRIVAALVNARTSPEVEHGDAAQHGAARRQPGGVGAARHAEEALALGHARRRRDAHRARPDPLALSNKGGVITLVDDKGLKVDGVSYTRSRPPSRAGRSCSDRSRLSRLCLAGTISRGIGDRASALDYLEQVLTSAS